MNPATTSKRTKGQTKLLALTCEGGIEHTTVGKFVHYLSKGDLVVVNASATLPSSFRGTLRRTGEFIEVRLASFQGSRPRDLSQWLAFTFGKGDWRIPTEERKKAPLVKSGDQIDFGNDLFLTVTEVTHERMVRVRFESPQLHRNLYRYGKPIQYSYLKEDLAVWDQQTIFSGPPLSVEPPSASFPFTWDLIFALKEKGIEIADVLHGAGISSTGESRLDQLLPLKEWYYIPERTVEKFNQAKASKGKVLVIGTSALRALESAWEKDKLKAGSDFTALKIIPGYQIKTADALVTGMHEVGASHMNILDSICPVVQIQKGYEEAASLGYRGHEYGDITYLNCKR